MNFDLTLARHDTPGCQNVLHFNNAGAGLMPSPVLKATIAHLEREAHIGAYEAAKEANLAIEHVYDAVASLLHCQRDEVAICENATRAWDMAFYSLPFQPGDKIVTAMNEYASNYIAFLQISRRTGAEIVVIPDDEYGQISLTHLERAIDPHVKLIALTYLPTNGGLVNPAAAVGKIARQAGILYLLDACQAAGQLPLDVQELGCDFFSATGRKYLRGPRGTGFLYVRKEVIPSIEPIFLDLLGATWTSPESFEIRPDARRFETWESNYAAKIGLGVAIDYALHWDIQETWNYLASLAEKLRQQLRTLPGIQVHDQGLTKGGIVTFSLINKTAEEVKTALSREKINVHVTIRSATLLDMHSRKLPDLVRASVHYYNDAAEIVRFCEALERIIVAEI